MLRYIIIISAIILPFVIYYLLVRFTKKIIENCLKKSKGPFIFKKFSIADAMYAPVMFRFKIYNVKLSFILEKYLNTLLNMKEIKNWLLEAIKELK